MSAPYTKLSKGAKAAANYECAKTRLAAALYPKCSPQNQAGLSLMLAKSCQAKILNSSKTVCDSHAKSMSTEL